MNRHLVFYLIGSDIESRSLVESEVKEISNLDDNVGTGRSILVIDNSIQQEGDGVGTEISDWVNFDLFVGVPTKLPVLCGIETHGWGVVTRVTVPHVSRKITIFLVCRAASVFTGMMQTDVVSNLMHLCRHSLAPYAIVIRIPSTDVGVG